MKNNVLKLAILLIIAITYWQWLTFTPNYEIISPRLGMPAIKLAQQPLQIKIKSNQLFPSKDFAVSLKKGIFHRPLSINKVEQNGVFLTLFTTIDKDLPIGKYDLLLSQNKQTWQRENAVYILKKYKDDLKVVQFADLPWMSDKITVDEAGDLMLDKIIEEINIINPDLVLVSGDNAYGGSWGQYESLYHALLKLQPPLVIVPGNHEYQGWNGYLSFFGKTRHVVDYGNYRILSFNSGHGRDQLTYSQFNWIKAQLQQAPNKTFIVQLHHPLFGGYGPLKHRVDDLIKLFKQYDVQIVLSGHTHADRVFNQKGENLTQLKKIQGPPYAIVTTAGRDWRKQWATSTVKHGYRLIRFKNRKLHDYTYDHDGDGKRDVSSSIPWKQINITVKSATNVTIKNQLNETFADAHYTFNVDTGQIWQVNTGTIVASDDNKVSVTFVLNAKSEVNLKLTKVKQP